MLEHFFQLGPMPVEKLTGVYDSRLVVLSYIIATLASYLTLDITARLREISITQLNTTLWIGGGALALGGGIWAMHFIGMLAFTLPMPMNYDALWTFFSLLVAIAVSGVALLMLARPAITFLDIVLGGIIVGLGIATMHYTGMQAMTVDTNIRYVPSLFILSILIAIVASQAALFLALKSTQVVHELRFRLKVVSALIIAGAICGMHYTGMSAAVFSGMQAMPNAPSETNVSPELMAISVAGMSILILAVGFIVSTYKESLNKSLLLKARQAGMAEIAASVLHNVGNVLNSINVSSMLIAEKLSVSKLSELAKLSKLIDENKDNLASF